MKRPTLGDILDGTVTGYAVVNDGPMCDLGVYTANIISEGGRDLEAVLLEATPEGDAYVSSAAVPLSDIGDAIRIAHAARAAGPAAALVFDRADPSLGECP